MLAFLYQRHVLAVMRLCLVSPVLFFFFFFNDTATTEIYTLSLHDALPISAGSWRGSSVCASWSPSSSPRSEEHTSELQSPGDLVCRLLLEKKKKKYNILDIYLTIVLLIIIIKKNKIK